VVDVWAEVAKRKMRNQSSGGRLGASTALVGSSGSVGIDMKSLESKL